MNNEYDPNDVILMVGSKEGVKDYFTSEATDKPFIANVVNRISIRVTDENPHYKEVKNTQKGAPVKINNAEYIVTEAIQMNIGNKEWVDLYVESVI